MIRLHQFEISPFADKIRRILNWKQIPYECVDYGVSGVMKIRRINPAGKVPVLEHDGVWISDSSDIALYLEKKFPDRPLYPMDSQARAQAHVLEDWADESLYFMEMSLRFLYPENARRFLPMLMAKDPAWLQRVFGGFILRSMRGLLSNQGHGRRSHDARLHDLQRHIDSVGQWLGDREYFFGAEISIADIAVYVQLYCIGLTPEGRAVIDTAAAVVEWMQRVDTATM